LLAEPGSLLQPPTSRSWSINSLASAAGMSQPVLWRLVHAPEHRSPTIDELVRICASLGLPADFFVEARLWAVTETLRAHPRRLDRLHDRLRRDGVLRPPG